MPRISVILTSYNHAKFLRAAIDSTLTQTFTDYELFIWDDASSDESWDIIQSYHDPRIRAFRNESQQRPIYGLNRVISGMATGEYIAIHHSDDIWEPGKLEAQVNFLDSHPQHGAVFTNVQMIDERGHPFTDRSHGYYGVFEHPVRNRYEWLNFFFFHGNGLCHPSVLIRKAFFDQYGLYRRGFSNLTDFDTWVRLCLHYEIFVLPERLVQFRVLEGNANAGSPTPERVIRGEFEAFRVLDNFLQVTEYEEMAAIFPEAGKYMRPGYFDARFVLGMLAVESHASRRMTLFGLNLLLDALAEPARAAQLKASYDFDLLRFHEMKGSHEIFTDQALRSRVQAIENDRGWRLLQRLRDMRLQLIPSKSTREKIWYALSGHERASQ